MDRVDWEIVFIYLSVWLTVSVLLSLTSLSPHQSPFLFGNLIHCCCTLWSITQRYLSRGSLSFSLFSFNSLCTPAFPHPFVLPSVFLSLSLCMLCSFVWHHVSIPVLTFPFSFLLALFLAIRQFFQQRHSTPPPFCSLTPSSPSFSSSCGSAPIREMITLRHSLIWQRTAAARTLLP